LKQENLLRAVGPTVKWTDADNGCGATRGGSHPVRSERPNLIDCQLMISKLSVHCLIRLSLAVAMAMGLSQCANGPVARLNEANTSAAQIERDSRAALRSLYASNAGARALGSQARAVLVFPAVTRGGLLVGGQTGTGAMIWNTGQVGGFYQTTSVSYGLQAGVQRFGYALFLMNDDALQNLNRSGGWEIGGSPSLVVVDSGMASSLTNVTVNKNTYAMFFNQRGLMAGLGLQGSKITRIHPR